MIDWLIDWYLILLVLSTWLTVIICFSAKGARMMTLRWLNQSPRVKPFSQSDFFRLSDSYTTGVYSEVRWGRGSFLVFFFLIFPSLSLLKMDSLTKRLGIFVLTNLFYYNFKKFTFKIQSASKKKHCRNPVYKCNGAR